MIDDMAYLTVGQTAIRMNLAEAQVIRLIREQQIEARMVGRAWLVDAAAVERYLAAKRSGSGAAKSVS